MKRLGKYVLEEVLGGGGIATLYRGRHAESGHEVAVKVLKATMDVDPMIHMRFEREAVTIARIHHPNIVHVLDFGRQGDAAFMVLELLRGESLQAVIARDGPLDPTRAVAIVDCILAALARCHEHDVVHRDVKPSNVMLVEGDVVKLIDFGLARVGRDAGEKLTETGTVHGTPHYMSPEQCRGEDVGSASDIYSVGVLSYEMLAGKTPFAGSDAATLMAAHLFVDPPALANGPSGLAAVVRSALAKRPEDRPTASALRAAFAEAMSGADPVTRGALDVERRVEHLARPREERAIGGGQLSAPAADGVVHLWMPNDARAASLLGCLGTAGIQARLVDDIEAPSGVVIVSGLDRLRRFRERDRKSRVVAVDIGGPDETTEAIRVGADDMLLRDAPDADLVAKIQRLFRRRPRS
jgi:serine/threonine protein kinase